MRAALDISLALSVSALRLLMVPLSSPVILVVLRSVPCWVQCPHPSNIAIYWSWNLLMVHGSILTERLRNSGWPRLSLEGWRKVDMFSSPVLDWVGGRRSFCFYR